MSRMEVDRNGLEVMDREECLRLLGTTTLGRIAMTSSALPTILPVNFWFDGRRILIRTGAGTKLDAATLDQVVAFEVDQMDEVYHSGWSVVVTGVATRIPAREVEAHLVEWPLPRWAPVDASQVMAIDPVLVSGRRLERHHPAPLR